MVEISCTYRYPKKQDGRDPTVQETLWFTKRDRDKYVDLRRDADYADRVEYSCGENRCYSYSCYVKCTLRIRDLRLSDSAEYKFQFITNQPAGNILVTLEWSYLWQVNFELLMSLLNILWMCLKVFIIIIIVIIIIIIIIIIYCVFCVICSHTRSPGESVLSWPLPVLPGQSWNVTVCVV